MRKEIEAYCPKSRSEWRQWLEENHQVKAAVWLVYYKASAKVASISWREAVDEALCFGWIDSTRKTIDDERFIQYFSRRNPNSTWSKVNKEKVAELIQANLMTKAGLDSIATAQQNGSWELLDEVEALVVSEDLKEALSYHDGATDYFDSLSRSNKKMLLYWVVSAKRVETRQKRIKEVAACAGKNLKPKQFR